MDEGENAAAAADERVALSAMYDSSDATVCIHHVVPDILSACCHACAAAVGAVGASHAFSFAVTPAIPASMEPLLMVEPVATGKKSPSFCNAAVLHNLFPITVCGTLPTAYPSHTPPAICVHAPWLTADDAAAIAVRLVCLWAEMPLMMAGLACDAPLPLPARKLVLAGHLAELAAATPRSTADGFSAPLLHCGQLETAIIGASPLGACDEAEAGGSEKLWANVAGSSGCSHGSSIAAAPDLPPSSRCSTSCSSSLSPVGQHASAESKGAGTATLKGTRDISASSGAIRPGPGAPFRKQSGAPISSSPAAAGSTVSGASAAKSAAKPAFQQSHVGRVLAASSTADGEAAAAATLARLHIPQPLHTCQRVRFPSNSGASVAARASGAGGAAGAAGAFVGDVVAHGVSHGHWGFESIVLPDYSCPACAETVDHGATAASGSGGGSGAGGGGAVCLFSWVEWLRNECVPWLLRRAKLLTRAAAAVLAGEPSRSVTADDLAGHGLSPAVVAELAFKGCLPRTSFQPIIVGQPVMSVGSTAAASDHVGREAEAALPVAELETGTLGAGSPACVSGAGGAGNEQAASAADGLARMLSPLQQEAVETIVAESTAAVPHTAPISAALPGAGRPSTKSVTPASTVGGKVSTAKSQKPLAGSQPVPQAARAPRGSMHWLPPHSLVAGRFAPPAGLVEPSADACGSARHSLPASVDASAGSAVGGAGSAAPRSSDAAAGSSAAAVVWVLAPGGSTLPTLAGKHAAAAGTLLSWSPSECAAQVELVSAFRDAKAAFDIGHCSARESLSKVWQASSEAARRCFVATVAHDAVEEER